MLLEILKAADTGYLRGLLFGISGATNRVSANRQLVPESLSVLHVALVETFTSARAAVALVANFRLVHGGPRQVRVAPGLQVPVALGPGGGGNEPHGAAAGRGAALSDDALKPR